MRRVAAVALIVAASCSDSASTTTESAISTAPTTPATSTTTTPPHTGTAPLPLPADTVPPPTSPLPPLEVVMDELREVVLDDPPLELLIAIPRLEGVPEIEDQVNQYLLDHVTRTEQAFVRNVTEYLDQVGPVDGPVSFLELFYDVGVLSPQLLSMRFDETTFYQGAANPSRGTYTITVDLNNGAMLSLEDVFTGTEWGFALDFLLRQAVAERYYQGDPTEIDAWLDPDFVLIPEDFMLTPLAFEFWFQELAVGPAVLGAPSVRLPYNAIGVYIDPNGLVGQMAEDAEVGCAVLAEFSDAKDRVFTSEIGSKEQAAALEDARMWATELRADRPDLSSAVDVLAGWAAAFVDNPSTELTAAEMDAIEASNDVLRSETDLCG